MPAESSAAKSSLLKKLGASLKAIRNDKGVEVKQIAAWLDLSQQAYLNMENGKTDISLTRIMDLTKLLDVDINHLLDIECDGKSFKPDGENRIVYTLNGFADLAPENDISVTDLLKHQLQFLKQQQDHLSALLENERSRKKG